MSSEIAVRFTVGDEGRIGILHLPETPATQAVLILSGGWQCRPGSHRQFVLLARTLAAAGIAALRFDWRGMGDSDGEPGEPEPAEYHAQDIRAALDLLADWVPSARAVVLCGLCDGASAALAFAPKDARVTGLVLLNPWVADAGGAARTRLQHYYAQRLRDPAFWRKVFHLRINLRAALHGFGGTVRASAAPADEAAAEDPAAAAGARITCAMANGLAIFSGPILLVLSGHDLTAAQYASVVAASPRWRVLLASGQAARVDMPDADHTFSSRNLRDALAAQIVAWLQAHHRTHDIPRPLSAPDVLASIVDQSSLHSV